jgi:hypothetical protein
MTKGAFLERGSVTANRTIGRPRWHGGFSDGSSWARSLTPLVPSLGVTWAGVHFAPCIFMPSIANGSRVPARSVAFPRGPYFSDRDGASRLERAGERVQF